MYPIVILAGQDYIARIDCNHCVSRYRARSNNSHVFRSFQPIHRPYFDCDFIFMLHCMQNGIGVCVWQVRQGWTEDLSSETTSPYQPVLEGESILDFKFDIVFPIYKWHKSFVRPPSTNQLIKWLRIVESHFFGEVRQEHNIISSSWDVLDAIFIRTNLSFRFNIDQVQWVATTGTVFWLLET